MIENKGNKKKYICCAISKLPKIILVMLRSNRKLEDFL